MDNDTNVFGPVILEGTELPVNPKTSDDSDTAIS